MIHDKIEPGVPKGNSDNNKREKKEILSRNSSGISKGPDYTRAATSYEGGKPFSEELGERGETAPGQQFSSDRIGSTSAVYNIDTPADENQEIDLIEITKRLWRERRFLLKTAGIGMLIGVVIAFSLPKEYVTTVRLAPETIDVSKRMNGLGGLAAMAGINLNTSTGSDAISPDLYPDVVQSTPFLLELFPVQVAFPADSDSMSVYDYLLYHQRQVWWEYILQAPFKAWGLVKNLFSSSADEKVHATIDPFHLSKVQQSVLQALQRRITVSVDKKTMVITVSVEMQNALVSACLTQVVLEKLQEYITDYRTRKVKNDLEFTNKVYKEARDRYYEAQHAYASFEDANRNLISSSYRTEQERLKNEMTLAFNVYNTLAQKMEQDKLRVQEQTPVYTVIEPASVPLKAASPKKGIIVAGSLFLGLIGGIGYLFLKDMLVGNK